MSSGEYSVGSVPAKGLEDGPALAEEGGEWDMMKRMPEEMMY